ncbi:DUF4261 domain-containing protein [Hymenobacter persicinus]|uniref:DUF4261 domain-containing protein n=1 Tax=Hymenobacter persicinus TaxID=2025506 RepID=A0A4Q5L7B7_9BACT|nr:DUF4261 domain-containing protein [Hymenobacter persicinus]RYU76706.1 DUF4261 domain-containing protein [Hymenobacter persicinus]
MGIFDFLKKKNQVPPPEEEWGNYPQMLTAKLLFENAPVFDRQSILEELKKVFTEVDNPSPQLFFFPEIRVELADKVIPAQCTIFFPDAGKVEAVVSPESFQQNWHWSEATKAAVACRYEVLLSDFMTRQLDYKSRLMLFMNFLTAVTKAMNPQVVYALGAQKLIAPADLVDSWENSEKRALHGLVNVRLFNVSNGVEGETILDTVGLYLLGLPDFQIRFTHLDESEVGQLLWNYAYYTYEQGDVITDGSTIQGLTPGSKWKCERQESLVAPERMVINIQPV